MLPVDLLTPSLMRVSWRPFINISEEKIPPHACMRVVSTTKSNGEILYRCAKPNATLQTLYRINGPFEVAVNKLGICSTLSEGGLVKGSAGAQNGQEYGATQNSWSLIANRPGFRIEGTFEEEGLMVATQREVDFLIGKNSGAISLDGQGTFIPWMSGDAGSETASEYSLTVWNRTSPITAAAQWCAATRTYGSWNVALLRCA